MVKRRGQPVPGEETPNGLLLKFASGADCAGAGWSGGNAAQQVPRDSRDAMLGLAAEARYGCAAQGLERAQVLVEPERVPMLGPRQELTGPGSGVHARWSAEVVAEHESEESSVDGQCDEDENARVHA